MSDSKIFKRKRKPNWMQENLLLLINWLMKNLKMCSWDNLQDQRLTLLKSHYRQIFLKCLHCEADCRQQPFSDSLWSDLSDLRVLFTTYNLFHRFRS